MGGFIAFIWIFIIAAYVLNGIAFMRLAKIAGRPEIGWMAWVPIANTIQQLLLIKKSGWLVFLLIIPIVNFIMMIVWQVNLLNAFGKNGAYVLFYIFLSPVYEILWIVWGLSEDTTYTLSGGFSA